MSNAGFFFWCTSGGGGGGGGRGGGVVGTWKDSHTSLFQMLQKKRSHCVSECEKNPQRICGWRRRRGRRKGRRGEEGGGG